MDKNKKIVLGIMIGVCSLLIMVYIGMCVWYYHHFFPGTYINGMDCSNKTADEVVEMLVKDIPEYALTLTERDGQADVLEGEAIGFSYDYPEVRQIKKRQMFLLWFVALFTQDSYEAARSGSCDEAKLTEKIKELNCLVRTDIQMPENARIEDSDNGPQIIEEIQGNAADEAKLAEAVKKAVSEEKTSLNLDEAGCYKVPEVTLESPEIKASAEKIEKLSNFTITYDFRYETEEVGSETIRSWLVQGGEDGYEISRERVSAFVSELAKRHNTVWASRDFYSTTRGWMSVEGGTYGWEIDESGEVERLLADLEAGENVTREPIFNMDPFPGVKSGNDIGDTYIEIDFNAQHMWFYKNGSLVIDTDVTTGTMSTNHGTPAGVFYIINRMRNTRLIGENYDTEVSYWMAVYGQIGIHDAVWRSDFGKDYYLTDGSHGCINTPYSVVEVIFNNIEVGTPVIMYY